MSNHDEVALRGHEVTILRGPFLDSPCLAVEKSVLHSSVIVRIHENDTSPEYLRFDLTISQARGLAEVLARYADDQQRRHDLTSQAITRLTEAGLS